MESSSYAKIAFFLWLTSHSLQLILLHIPAIKAIVTRCSFDFINAKVPQGFVQYQYCETCQELNSQKHLAE